MLPIHLCTRKTDVVETFEYDNVSDAGQSECVAIRSNDGVVARLGPICSDAKAGPSCRGIFLMASSLLAVLLFGLLRMRLIK
jgi:hypothetical protein